MQTKTIAQLAIPVPHRGYNIRAEEGGVVVYWGVQPLNARFVHTGEVEIYLSVDAAKAAIDIDEAA